MARLTTYQAVSVANFLASTLGWIVGGVHGAGGAGDEHARCVAPGDAVGSLEAGTLVGA